MNRLRLLSISIYVRFMRKWYLPATVLGIGGLGVVGNADRHRARTRRPSAACRKTSSTPRKSFEEWNDSALRELESIQSALDSLSQALGVRPAAQ